MPREKRKAGRESRDLVLSKDVIFRQAKLPISCEGGSGGEGVATRNFYGPHIPCICISLSTYATHCKPSPKHNNNGKKNTVSGKVKLRNSKSQANNKGRQ